MMIMMRRRKRRMAMKIIQIIGGLPLGKERGILLGKSVLDVALARPQSFSCLKSLNGHFLELLIRV